MGGTTTNFTFLDKQCPICGHQSTLCHYPDRIDDCAASDTKCVICGGWIKDRTIGFILGSQSINESVKYPTITFRGMKILYDPSGEYDIFNELFTYCGVGLIYRDERFYIRRYETLFTNGGISDFRRYIDICIDDKKNIK